MNMCIISIIYTCCYSLITYNTNYVNGKCPHGHISHHKEKDSIDLRIQVTPDSKNVSDKRGVLHLEEDLADKRHLLSLSSYKLWATDDRVLFGSFITATDFVQLSSEIILVVDCGAHCLREIFRPNRSTTVFAGKCGSKLTDGGDGVGTDARFYNPFSILQDKKDSATYWVGQTGALRYVNRTSKTVGTYYSSETFGLVYSMVWYNDDLILCQANDGLFQFNFRRRTLRKIGLAGRADEKQLTDGSLNEITLLSPLGISGPIGKNFYMLNDYGNVRILELEGNVNTLCASEQVYNGDFVTAIMLSSNTLYMAHAVHITKSQVVLTRTPESKVTRIYIPLPVSTSRPRPVLDLSTLSYNVVSAVTILVTLLVCGTYIAITFDVKVKDILIWRTVKGTDSRAQSRRIAMAPGFIQQMSFQGDMNAAQPVQLMNSQMNFQGARMSPQPVQGMNSQMNFQGAIMSPQPVQGRRVVPISTASIPRFPAGRRVLPNSTASIRRVPAGRGAMWRASSSTFINRGGKMESQKPSNPGNT